MLPWASARGLSPACGHRRNSSGAVESAGNKLDEAQKDLDEFDRGVAMLRKIATDNAGADPATGEVD